MNTSRVGDPLFDVCNGLIDPNTGNFTLDSSNAFPSSYVFLAPIEKIFNACGLNPFNCYEAFDGSKTDVELSLYMPRVRTKEVHPGIEISDQFTSRKEDRPDNQEHPRELDIPYREYESFRDKTIKVRHLILGEFIPAKENGKVGKIIIYTRNIARFELTKKVGYQTVFWTVLAHEVFHAMHYNLFQRNGIADKWSLGKNINDDEIVKESLADYAELIFLRKGEYDYFKGNNISDYDNHLHKAWRSYCIDDWPYSGAYVIDATNMTDNLIRHLLEASLRDWKTPAEALKVGYYMRTPDVNKIATANNLL